MTSNPLELIGSLLAGVFAGGLFFGGLWWTVRRLAGARYPGLLMVVSALLRAAFVLGLFFLLGREHFERMLACLVGFVIGRILVFRYTRPKNSKEERPCT